MAKISKTSKPISQVRRAKPRTPGAAPPPKKVVSRQGKVPPALFDTLLATSPRRILGPVNWTGETNQKMVKRIERLLPRLRSADKMVFDDAASIRVGEVLREIPELLVEQIQFARAPFEITWIEYQAERLWEALGGHASRYQPNDLTRDRTVGVLIDHNRINVFTQTFEGELGFLPWVYHLHTEWPLEDQLKFAETFEISRLSIDAWLWGSAADRFLNDPTGKGRRYLRALRDNTMVEILDGAYDNIPLRNREMVLSGSNGDFKNIVALLLMVNQPKLTKYIEVPRRTGWVGNKHRPFMAYHNISVALDAVPQIKLVSQSGDDPVMRRGCKVRGHYCQNKTARDYASIAGCVHNWIPTDIKWTPQPHMPVDEREHWVCRVCEGRRWWRDESTRGSTIGFVHHPQYNVTMRGQP